MVEWVVPFFLALGAGTLAAWGVGGGTLLLLCMTLFLGVEQDLARAVNLLFFLPTAAAGLWFHRREGYLDGAVWKQAGIPGAAAALVGAGLAAVVEVELLRRPFGLFLLACGASMLGGRGKKQDGGR